MENIKTIVEIIEEEVRKGGKSLWITKSHFSKIGYGWWCKVGFDPDLYFDDLTVIVGGAIHNSIREFVSLFLWFFDFMMFVGLRFDARDARDAKRGKGWDD